MTIDIAAAEHFVLTHARLLERLRLAVLLHDESPRATLTALLAYQNDDGGFGLALEPDLRAPHSETTATVSALDLLAELDALHHPAAQRALRWVGTVTRDDGGIPLVLAATAGYPHAPWMQPNPEGSHLTFALATIARRVGSEEPWVEVAQAWCWDRLSESSRVDGYLLKYALGFLDAHPDRGRAEATLGRLGRLVGPDGSVPVLGGTADEKLTPLALSPHPGSRSRSLFTEQQVRDDVERLAQEQQGDGGWTFDWLEWCPAQGLDWRGVQTVQALATLQEHGYPRT